jgi:hypothetical protein
MPKGSNEVKRTATDRWMCLPAAKVLEGDSAMRTTWVLSLAIRAELL